MAFPLTLTNSCCVLDGVELQLTITVLSVLIDNKFFSGSLIVFVGDFIDFCGCNDGCC